MSHEQKPGDPADKGLDTFQPTTSHRAGYGDDKLARLVDYLRQRPSATLASGEGALLLAEIDRLHAAELDGMDHYTDARNEIDRLRDDLQKQADWADWAKGEMERLREQLRDTHTEVFHLAEKLSFVERERDQLTSLPADRILAALREPSKGVVDVVFRNVFESDPAFEDQCRAAAQEAIRAAVAAAEQEVGRA